MRWGMISIINGSYLVYCFLCVNAKTDYTYLPQSSCISKPDPPSTKSNNFSLWGFLTAGIVMSSVVGNLISNVNNDNNNNNNNNNQISNNNRNENSNAGENSNMNTNMIIPGRRREFQNQFTRSVLNEDMKIYLKNCSRYLICKYLTSEGYGKMFICRNF